MGPSLWRILMNDKEGMKKRANNIKRWTKKAIALTVGGLASTALILGGVIEGAGGIKSAVGAGVFVAMSLAVGILSMVALIALGVGSVAVFTAPVQGAVIVGVMWFYSQGAA